MVQRYLVVMLGFLLAVPVLPDLGAAQPACPPEVEQAKEMLSQKQTAAVKPEDVQVPRSMAGARQDAQSPRGNQDVQSPRGNQNVQSPRGNQDVQSPRGNQDVQSPRGNQDVQSPRGNQNVQSPRGNQDVQSPRGNQDVQSPRGNQDVQSPRGNQDVQSPRGNQDVQSPRGNQDVQSPRVGAGTTASTQAPKSSNLKKAASLVKEAEAACKAGNMTQASKKAKSAMALLK
ncbi:MAG TPA: hypothetical protein VMI34_21080 [Candidatus Bathyarchaeia archaeon]|nr:hypothetical protein [Candidatus Bathyarchaeia archaeon]